MSLLETCSKTLDLSDANSKLQVAVSLTSTSLQPQVDLMSGYNLGLTWRGTKVTLIIIHMHKYRKIPCKYFLVRTTKSQNNCKISERLICEKRCWYFNSFFMGFINASCHNWPFGTFFFFFVAQNIIQILAGFPRLIDFVPSWNHSPCFFGQMFRQSRPDFYSKGSCCFEELLTSLRRPTASQVIHCV